MIKGISRRLAAVCVLSAVSFGTAHAASPAPAAMQSVAVVRALPAGGPVVKLGTALLQEYSVTPTGVPVMQETVRNAGQSAQAMPAKPAPAATHKA